MTTGRLAAPCLLILVLCTKFDGSLCFEDLHLVFYCLFVLTMHTFVRWCLENQTKAKTKNTKLHVTLGLTSNPLQVSTSLGDSQEGVG